MGVTPGTSARSRAPAWPTRDCGGSTILLGAPALELVAFASRERRTILGVSLTMVAPLGQYDSTKLINISSNR
jgi:hypothetical protein